MGRKSKQPGGHNPLTYHERKKYAKNSSYGTETKRLGRDSQNAFGDCCLSLHPAKDRPVATPSGYIYERTAMLDYLLTKTQQLKRDREEYEDRTRRKLAMDDAEREKKRQKQVKEFENSNKVEAAKDRTTEEGNTLKRTSYWLADMQPDEYDANDTARLLAAEPPPPKRPPSPNTNRPLRRKDLIDLDVRRDPDDDDKVLCAISEKQISTQPAVALVTTKGGDRDDHSKHPAAVVLEQVYDDLGKERACPVTGRKIRKVLKLRRGGSSFATMGNDDNDRGSGPVIEAKRYRPTMT